MLAPYAHAVLASISRALMAGPHERASATPRLLAQSAANNKNAAPDLEAARARATARRAAKQGSPIRRWHVFRDANFFRASVVAEPMATPCVRAWSSGFVGRGRFDLRGAGHVLCWGAGRAPPWRAEGAVGARCAVARRALHRSTAQRQRQANHEPELGSGPFLVDGWLPFPPQGRRAVPAPVAIAPFSALSRRPAISCRTS